MVLPIALQPNRIGTIAAFCLAAATGCGSSPSAAPGGVEIGDGGGDGAVPGAHVDQANVARDPASGIPGSTLDAAVAANNAFGLDLYGQLMGDGGGGNVLISPLSASLALTMTYAGAEGETASEMASVLHANLPDGASIFDGQNALDQALLGRGSAAFAQAQEGGGEPAPVSSDYQLQIANAVWGEETFPWSSGFLNTLARSYGTGVYLTDFANAPGQAVVAINDWVSAETAGKITNLLAPTDVDATTAMVLVNALHVKFPWDSPFDPSQTAPATFTRADGTTVSPSFMNQTTTLPYDDDGQAQIVELPLYADEEALVVILPHAGTSLATYEATLVANGGLPQPGASQDVALSIPKITLGGTTFPLAAALKALGMQQAFMPHVANFTGMCPPPDGSTLYISFVLQQTTLTMQETGLEAAAATAVGVSTASIAGPPPTPVSVVVNRPYLIAIVDVATGAILFIGHVEDPTAP
ncbi:MAG: serpin family protein [Polyangiaceae bacterium]